MEGASGTGAGLSGVKHVVVVLSGKGGVGKSTVAAQVALCLAAMGKKTGLLDVDLCGPSAVRVLGLEGKEVMQSSQGWVPVYADASQNLAVLSLAFLLKSSEDAVVWRGPKKNSMIKQFLQDVLWGELDYLIIDTPPGTSDEQISTIEYLKSSGANLEGGLIVTTPQAVSVADVRKEISFCNKLEVKVLGVIENMSGFVCPCCEEVTNIFSRGGGEGLAKELNLLFLGRIPLDPRMAQSEDAGKSMLEEYPDSPAVKVLQDAVKQLISATSG